MQNAQGTISSAILFFKFQAHQQKKNYFALQSTSLKEGVVSLKNPILPALESNIVKNLTKKMRQIQD